MFVSHKELCRLSGIMSSCEVVGICQATYELDIAYILSTMSSYTHIDRETTALKARCVFRRTDTEWKLSVKVLVCRLNPTTPIWPISFRSYHDYIRLVHLSKGFASPHFRVVPVSRPAHVRLMQKAVISGVRIRRSPKFFRRIYSELLSYMLGEEGTQLHSDSPKGLGPSRLR